MNSVSSPTLTYSGATIPGIPYAIVGSNKRLTWSFIPSNDNNEQLFYTEQGANAGQVAVRDEVIKVLGEELVHLEARDFIRGTSYYPIIDKDIVKSSVISALPNEYNEIILKSPSLLQPMDTSVLRSMNEATNWDEFVAIGDYIRALSVNVLYADYLGNIGYVVTGR